MKPKEKKPEIIFRIIDRDGNAVGSYSRAYCDEYDFRSPEEARSASCHNMFKDKSKYRIAKYRVTYELIDEDCDTKDPNTTFKDRCPEDFEEFEEGASNIII